MEKLYRITSLFRKDRDGDLWPVVIQIPDLDDWSDSDHSGDWLSHAFVESGEVLPKISDLPLGSVIERKDVRLFKTISGWVDTDYDLVYGTLEDEYRIVFIPEQEDE